MLILAGQSLKEVLLSPNFLQISETQTFTVHSQERIEQKHGLDMGHFLQSGNFSCFEPFSLKKKEPYIQILSCSYCSCHTDNDDDGDEEENGEANYLPPPIEECSQPGNLCPPPSPPPPPYLPLLTLSSKPWWLHLFKTLTATTTFFCRQKFCWPQVTTECQKKETETECC